MSSTVNVTKCLAAFASFCKHQTERRDADVPLHYGPFHSSQEPSIPLSEYGVRIAHYTEADTADLMLSLELIGRYCRSTHKLPSVLSMHRLLLTSIRIVTKVQHDRHRSNRAFARICGINIDELRRLEVHLLHAVNFGVFFVRDDLDHVVEHFTAACAAQSDVAVVGAVGVALGVQSLHSLIDFIPLWEHTEGGSAFVNMQQHGTPEPHDEPASLVTATLLTPTATHSRGPRGSRSGGVLTASLNSTTNLSAAQLHFSHRDSTSHYDGGQNEDGLTSLEATAAALPTQDATASSSLAVRRGSGTASFAGSGSAAARMLRDAHLT